MTPSQMIGYAMINATSLSTLVSGRIYNGTRPQTSILPSVNFFEMAGGWRRANYEGTPFAINCRAKTEVEAQGIARKVVDLFHGSSSMGVYGNLNNFEITRASLKQKQGTIYESAEMVYNCPVDIFIVYPSSSVS